MITLILISDLSRLSRNMADFCDFYKILEKYHASFISIKEQFDTSTSFGEMMFFNMINLAQFERRQTSERIMMNFHARALRDSFTAAVPNLDLIVTQPIQVKKSSINPRRISLNDSSKCTTKDKVFRLSEISSIMKEPPEKCPQLSTGIVTLSRRFSKTLPLSV